MLICYFGGEGTAIFLAANSITASNVALLTALHDRSESRCSRTSVDTIDDVQQYFDLAIAAGENQLRQLKHEQGLCFHEPLHPIVAIVISCWRFLNHQIVERVFPVL